jgi:hypothetical protein
MSIALSLVSFNQSNFDSASTLKQAPKSTVADEIRQLASEGRSAHTISQTTGLPESLVATELGTTTSTSSSISQASALLALGTRLSVQV